MARVLALAIAGLILLLPAAGTTAHAQSTGQLHETLFAPGPSFNVGEIIYPSAHDFDTSASTDTCLSLNVPPGDTFTLSLEWEPLFGDPDDAGDLDLYLYLDSACTESALLTSSFNSNAYTGELLEVTPQVRNISAAPAVAGIRIGKRTGRGNPGQLTLKVLTGDSTFLEHGTTGPPLEGQEGAPTFQVIGPFSVPENSSTGTAVGTVTASDPQGQSLTFFELEPVAGQTSFQIDSLTGQITVEDPALLDREATETLVYWVGVTDGTAASLEGVGINLSGVNDNAPLANDTDSTTTPDTPVVISLSGIDADIDPAQQLNVSIATQPATGSVGSPVQQGATVSTVLYTPAPGFIGVDTFTFTVSDGLSTSAPATVTVTVTDDPGTQPEPTSTPGGPTPTPGPTIDPTSTPAGGPAVPPSSGPPPPAPAETPTLGAPADPIVPPSAPRLLRAEARDSSALITWQRPLSDGGAPIDGYRIFNVNTARSTLVMGDVLEGLVPGLENGTSYLFQVRAFNAAGFGEGGLVGPVTPTSGNPVVLEVSASAHPDDTVTVWWAPPEGDQLEPVVQYRLWTEAGELLELIDPGDPLIINIEDLENDKTHVFRVTASDADGQLVATGVSDPVYLPPTLESAYEPLPDDAILVSLTPQARTELELALRGAAGGVGTVEDVPAVLTVREGAALLFVNVEDLHRGLDLPGDFEVASEQLQVSVDGSGSPVVEIEIASGIWLTGSFDDSIDPSGILLELPMIELTAVYTLEETGPLTRFEVAITPQALAPGFVFSAGPPELVPDAMADVIELPSVRSATGVIEVARNGIETSDPAVESVHVTVTGEWHNAQIVDGNGLVLYRLGESGVVDSIAVACEPGLEPDLVICSSEVTVDPTDAAFYALAAVSEVESPEPTPSPTVLSAPTEPTPTPPALVVVKPTATAMSSTVAAPGPAPTPQITPTPDVPPLPETDGGMSGATIVTLLMSGILGLVVVRGAFYAVGRLRN